MKPIFSIFLAVLATALPLAADQALEPVDGEVRAWTIEDLYKVASADGRLSATMLAVTAGHGYHPIRLVATIWDDAPVEGEYGHSTTFDLGRVGGLEPPLRLEKVNDRLYRGKVLNWLPGEEGERRRASIVESALLAEGEVQDGGKTIVLKSQATESKNGEDAPVGPKKTQILHFKEVVPPGMNR